MMRRGTEGAPPCGFRNQERESNFCIRTSKGSRSRLFDPYWLEQIPACDQFSDGLVQWTLFGVDTSQIAIKPLPGKGKKALYITRPTTEKNKRVEAVKALR